LLTGAVEEVSKKSGLNERFLGLIILPIAGNACEHITAIFVALKNKMDLAIGVALGSSIQVAPLYYINSHFLGGILCTWVFVNYRPQACLCILKNIPSF
jgi:calcium/proton exchanger cax